MVSVNTTCFNVACWLFAMRYWTLSKILKLINEGSQPTKSKIFKYNVVMWIGLAFNFTFSMLYGYFLYIGVGNMCIYIIPPLIWITAFSFLLDGLWRIKKVMKTLSDRVVIFSAFMMQSLMCAIFILGQIPNVYFGIQSKIVEEYHSKAEYSALSIMENAICFALQVCLIIIFN